MTLPSPRKRAFKSRFPVVDALFLAGSAVLAAAMIVYAMSGETPEFAGFRLTDDSIMIEGEALTALVPGPGVEAQYDYAEAAAYVTSTATIESGGRLSAGAAILLPQRFERAVIGRRIRVTVMARVADSDAGGPPLLLHAGYFTTGGQHDSGWRPFPLEDDYREYSFEFDVSPDTVPNDEEWVGVWPDAAGLGRGVYVRRLAVVILEN